LTVLRENRPKYVVLPKVTWSLDFLTSNVTDKVNVQIVSLTKQTLSTDLYALFHV